MRIAWIALTYTWIASVPALALPALQIALLPMAIGAVAAILPTICQALPRGGEVDLPTARITAPLLGLAIALALTAAIGATTPAVWESEQFAGAAPPPVPLSGYLAPVLAALTTLAAVAALRRRTPRRLAAAAITLLCCWPFWLGLQGFCVMMFDDHRHDLVAPWALDALRIAATPLALLGIGLGLLAVRATTVTVPAMVALRLPRRA